MMLYRLCGSKNETVTATQKLCSTLVLLDSKPAVYGARKGLRLLSSIHFCFRIFVDRPASRLPHPKQSVSEVSIGRLYTCEECDGYCIADHNTGDYVCTECGLCCKDITIGWDVVGLPYESSSTQRKTVYEPVKYLAKKLHAVKLTSSQHFRVVCMFKQIGSVYQEVKGCRKSNLHYFYTVRKILEVLDEWEAAELVPRVKGKKKLVELDEIWRRIADRLDYTFFSSDPDGGLNRALRGHLAPDAAPATTQHDAVQQEQNSARLLQVHIRIPANRHAATVERPALSEGVCLSRRHSNGQLRLQTPALEVS